MWLTSEKVGLKESRGGRLNGQSALDLVPGVLYTLIEAGKRDISHRKRDSADLPLRKILPGRPVVDGRRRHVIRGSCGGQLYNRIV